MFSKVVGNTHRPVLYKSWDRGANRDAWTERLRVPNGDSPLRKPAGFEQGEGWNG